MADLRKHFDNSDELCEYMADLCNGCTLLAFSTGKDSIVAWLKLRRYFRKIVPYYLYCVPNLEFIEKTFISPDNNHATIEVPVLPFRIGARQLDISAYPSRPFYMLDFDDYKLEDRVRGRVDDENDITAIQKGILDEKTRIRKNMPLKVTIEREFSEDRELLRIEDVTDREGAPISKNFFNLHVQSMSEVDNFWLDSGIFSLNISHSRN